MRLMIVEDSAQMRHQLKQAAALWDERIGPSRTMAAVTSVMRVQQILQAAVDDRLKRHGLTFARYEALVLLTFSSRGSLPLGKMGERLQVHPTSVTSIVQRLEEGGGVNHGGQNVCAAERSSRLSTSSQWPVM